QVIRYLESNMQTLAQNLEFEKAQLIKDKIDILERFKSKSVIVNPNINNVDVFSIISDENYGFVNYMKVINGAILQSQTIELRKKLGESHSQLIAFAIAELRQRFESDSKELLVNVIPDSLP